MEIELLNHEIKKTKDKCVLISLFHRHNNLKLNWTEAKYLF